MSLDLSSPLLLALRQTPNLAQIVDAGKPESAALSRVYLSLVEPLITLLKTNASTQFSVRASNPGTAAYQQTIALVNYSYSKRFSQSGEFLQFEDTLTNSALVEVSLESATSSVVLATVRASWGSTIDVFELFDFPGGWYNDANADQFGSIGRFALNPIFDVLFEARKQIGIQQFSGLDALRAELFRHAMSFAFQTLHEQGVETIYAITHATLQTWFTICGLNSQPIQDAQLAENGPVYLFKKLYPRYWDNQPTVYILKGMDEMSR